MNTLYLLTCACLHMNNTSKVRDRAKLAAKDTKEREAVLQRKCLC